jgi:hypothetical protein
VSDDGDTVLFMIARGPGTSPGGVCMYSASAGRTVEVFGDCGTSYQNGRLPRSGMPMDITLSGDGRTAAFSLAIPKVISTMPDENMLLYVSGFERSGARLLDTRSWFDALYLSTDGALLLATVDLRTTAPGTVHSSLVSRNAVQYDVATGENATVQLPGWRTFYTDVSADLRTLLVLGFESESNFFSGAQRKFLSMWFRTTQNEAFTLPYTFSSKRISGDGNTVAFIQPRDASFGGRLLARRMDEALSEPLTLPLSSCAAE